MKRTDLDVATPNEVPAILRTVADLYRHSSADLQSGWGDPDAGKVWEDFARILERAAKSCETVIHQRGL